MEKTQEFLEDRFFEELKLLCEERGMESRFDIILSYSDIYDLYRKIKPYDKQNN